MTDYDYQLRTVSIVMAPPSQEESGSMFNIQHLNPDSFSDRGIVPSNWEFKQFVQLPDRAILSYQEGIVWQVTLQRLTVTENIPSPYEFQDSYRVHSQVMAYLKEHSATYPIMGLNCSISLEVEEPVSFLARKFAPWIEGGTVLESLEFKKPIGKSLCTVKCETGPCIGKDGRETIGLVFECNHHFVGPFGSEGMGEQIALWKNCEQEVVSLIDNIIEGTSPK